MEEKPMHSLRWMLYLITEKRKEKRECKENSTAEHLSDPFSSLVYLVYIPATAKHLSI